VPAKRERFFKIGEKVRVAKKSHIIDRERDGEGLPPEERVPIEEDVTGYEGEVCSQPYESPLKDGASCVPIRLPNDAVIGVPEDRIEREGETSRSFGWSAKAAATWDRVFGKKKKKETETPKKDEEE
jgi:hypothetical protein